MSSTRTSSSAARPSLAVVVPALNEAGTLPELITSLFAATAPEDRPDELIVVDGGSADASAEIARRAGATVLAGHRGRGIQLGSGARNTESDVLLFLHADTRVEPGALRAVRAAFADEGVIATGMHQRIDHPDRVFRWIEKAANRRVRWGRVYGDSGLAVRRSAYEAVGGFRDLPIFEDLDLSRRLRRYGRIELVDDAVLTISPRRWQREGAVRRSVRNWVLTAAWKAGVPARRLARFYPPHSPAIEPSRAAARDSEASIR